MKHFFLLLFFINTILANQSNSDFQETFLNNEQKEFIKNHPIIKVSNEKDWAPYDFNENGTAKGYSVDYLKLLGKKIGVTFVFQSDTWSNLLDKVKNKEIDIIHPLSKNKTRKEYLNFTKVLFENDLSIVTSDINSDIKTLADLDYKTVSVARGWNQTKILKENYPKINFKNYDTALGKLKAVAFGEADATIDSYVTINFLKQKHLLNNIKIVGRANFPNHDSRLYIGIRKDWHILTDILNIAIESINSEELIALNKKWMLTHKKSAAFSKDELKFLNEKKTIYMCVDPDWMPYESIQNNSHIGMASEYFKIFRDILPIPIELVQTKTWTQTLQYAKNRKCDIISLAVETPKRTKYLNFSKPYLKIPLVVATKTDKPFVSNLNNILKYKLGVMKDYFHVELLRNKYPNIKLIEVSSMDEGIKKVLSGELFGFIDSLAAVGIKIQKDYLGNIKIAGMIDEEFTIGVATRKDIPILKTIFDKAADELTPEDHRIVLNKWVAVKYEKSFDYSYIWLILILILFISTFFIYRQYLLKKQNKALIESVDEFEHLLNSTIEAIFILENGKCIDSNLEGIKLFGYEKKEELIGLSALDVIDQRDHETLKKNLKKEKTSPYEVTGIKKDGTIFPVLIKGHDFRRNNKKIRVTAMIDLTELKQKEKLLAEHSKMVALGEMLGNIAHQWRQPLSVISTAASGVKVQKELEILNDEVFYDSMDAIVNNTDYLSKTIDDFNNFIKEDKQKEIFNLSQNIDRNLTILNGMIKVNHIETILNVDKSIELDNFGNELSQAFINIVNNAKDHLVEKDIKDKIIIISSYKQDNKVFLSIKDNAGGISEEIIDRVFEPYFTTKHKKQGTGLGLYMTRNIIVNSMKGDIKVKNCDFTYENHDYKGAEFIITL